MLYREMGQTGDQVSILGYGCMRFPRKDRHIDEARTARQIISAIEQGVNYFDTAYAYGASESVLGKSLAGGYRAKVFIATKLPLPLIHSRKDMETIFAAQLKRLQTECIDYYLMHSIMTRDGWNRLKKLGIEEFLHYLKESGKIRRVGFSYHGDIGQFRTIVDDYPWDMCQIQYNYLDEFNQAGKEGLEYAAAKGLGVAVMEPLRGGSLVGKMPGAIAAIWDQAPVRRSPAEWALRWIWNHPQVSLVLSGMNEESHIAENIRVAGDACPDSLSSGELQLFTAVKETFNRMMQVGCTGCGYCLPCPAGVNIPLCFSCYNNKHLFQERIHELLYLGVTTGADGGKPSYASLCRDCGQCEKRCPQHLPIRRHLKEVARDMQHFYFKPVAAFARGYYKICAIFNHGRQHA